VLVLWKRLGEDIGDLIVGLHIVYNCLAFADDIVTDKMEFAVNVLRMGTELRIAGEDDGSLAVAEELNGAGLSMSDVRRPCCDLGYTLGV
jgi:hypothetical protein